MNRVNVITSCPHGFFPDGSRRWRLRQDRLTGMTIDTFFAGSRDLTLDRAVWEIEGRSPFDHERERGLWSLKPVFGSAHASVEDQFQHLVMWKGYEQTAPFCGSCATAAARERVA